MNDYPSPAQKRAAELRRLVNNITGKKGCHMFLWISKIGKCGQFILPLGIVAVAMMSSGCATIVVGDKHKQVMFTSDPPGATLRANGTILGTTPVTITMRNINHNVIEFQKDGYQPRIVNLALEGGVAFEPWFYGNMLWVLTGPVAIIGLPVGFTVDYMTDHVYYMRSPFGVTLYPVGSAAPTAPVGLSTPSPSSSPPPAANPSIHSVADRLKSLKDLKDQGVINDSEYETKRAELMKEL